MSLANQFGTNKEAEKNGVEIKYFGPEGAEPTFIVGRSSRANPRYLKALERLTKPHRRLLDMKKLPQETAEKLWRDVFIEGVLLDWKNIPNSDVTGDPKAEGFATFTPENASALFVRLPDLYDDLQAKASDASTFRDESLEEDAGN